LKKMGHQVNAPRNGVVRKISRLVAMFTDC
jgi:hypothetical protein